MPSSSPHVMDPISPEDFRLLALLEELLPNDAARLPLLPWLDRSLLLTTLPPLVDPRLCSPLEEVNRECLPANWPTELVAVVIPAEEPRCWPIVDRFRFR